MKSRKHSGFTLPEVLMLLAIIGVVAAIVMPILVNKYNQMVTGIKIKKTYAEITEAIKLSEVQNGEMSTWTFGDSNSIENTRAFMEKYIIPYFTDLTECSTGGNDKKCGMPAGGNGINYVEDNGIGQSYMVDSQTNQLSIIVSGNITRKSYVAGKDWFHFIVNTQGKVQPYGWYAGIKRSDITTGYTFNDPSGTPIHIACNNSDTDDILSNRYACTALLVYDNWSFKDDYPW